MLFGDEDSPLRLSALVGLRLDVNNVSADCLPTWMERIVARALRLSDHRRLVDLSVRMPHCLAEYLPSSLFAPLRRAVCLAALRLERLALHLPVAYGDPDSQLMMGSWGALLCDLEQFIHSACVGTDGITSLWTLMIWMASVPVYALGHLGNALLRPTITETTPMSMFLWARWPPVFGSLNSRPKTVPFRIFVSWVPSPRGLRGPYKHSRWT